MDLHAGLTQSWCDFNPTRWEVRPTEYHPHQQIRSKTDRLQTARSAHCSLRLLMLMLLLLLDMRAHDRARSRARELQHSAACWWHHRHWACFWNPIKSILKEAIYHFQPPAFNKWGPVFYLLSRFSSNSFCHLPYISICFYAVAVLLIVKIVKAELITTMFVFMYSFNHLFSQSVAFCILLLHHKLLTCIHFTFISVIVNTNSLKNRCFVIYYKVYKIYKKYQCSREHRNTTLLRGRNLMCFSVWCITNEG